MHSFKIIQTAADWSTHISNLSALSHNMTGSKDPVEHDGSPKSFPCVAFSVWAENLSSGFVFKHTFVYKEDLKCLFQND